MFGVFSTFSFDDSDDYKEYLKTESKKKRLTVPGVLTWIVYAVVIFILTTVIIRLIMTKDPDNADILLTDAEIEAEMQALGDNFIIYEIDVQNAFLVGDTFFINNTVYLESSNNLQMTVRCKKNRFSSIIKELQKEDYADYDGLIKLYLKVSTKIETDEADVIAETDEVENSENAENPQSIENVIEISRKYKFDSAQYEYIRVSFDGVEIDYAKTKVELYMFPEYMEYSENEYLERVTIFDLNMPKSKVRIKDFKLSR